MTDLPELPEIDYTTNETAITSAENRAAMALQAGDGPLYWRGMELRFTPSIKSHFLTLRRLDGGGNGVNRDERDSMILLYLCSQPCANWTQCKGGQPLRARPYDWLTAIDEWADANISADDLDGEIIKTMDRLWAIHHATRPEVDEQQAGVLGNGQVAPIGA